MPRTAHHWLYSAYIALTQVEPISESEAIGKLQALYPLLPVLEIVQVEARREPTDLITKSEYPEW